MREVLNIAWPLVVSLSTSALMLFFDRIFLSWHSATSLQAVVPAGVLSFMFLCGFMALANYTGVFVSQHYGAKDYHGCSRVTFNGLVIAACSALIILLCIPLGCRLLGVFEDDPAVLAEELRFFRLIMISQAFVPLTSVFESFFNGIGRTQLTMRFSLLRDILKVILDYLLIFGHCGLPALGIRGAGWASIVCWAIAPLGLGWIYFSSKYNRQYHTRSGLAWDWTLCRHVMRFATPSAIHQTLEIASYSIFVLILGKFNDLEQIVGNIAISLQHLYYIAFIGLGISASILVGQHQGRQKPSLAAQSALNTLRLGMLLAAIFGISLLLVPKAYLAIFAGHGEQASLEEVLPLGRRLLAIQALWCFFSAGECIVANSLKGAGDTRFVMIYATILTWSFAAGNLALVYLCHASIAIVWLWCTTGGFLLAAGYIWRFYFWRRWQGIDMLQRKK